MAPSSSSELWPLLLHMRQMIWLKSALQSQLASWWRITGSLQQALSMTVLSEECHMWTQTWWSKSFLLMTRPINLIKRRAAFAVKLTPPESSRASLLFTVKPLSFYLLGTFNVIVFLYCSSRQRWVNSSSYETSSEIKKIRKLNQIIDETCQMDALWHSGSYLNENVILLSVKLYWTKCLFAYTCKMTIKLV